MAWEPMWKTNNAARRRMFTNRRYKYHIKGSDSGDRYVAIRMEMFTTLEEMYALKCDWDDPESLQEFLIAFSKDLDCLDINVKQLSENMTNLAMVDGLFTAQSLEVHLRFDVCVPNFMVKTKKTQKFIIQQALKDELLRIAVEKI